MVCHSLLIVYHSFTLITTYSTYVLFKFYEVPEKFSKFHHEYYLAIERNRCRLNDGYEMPKEFSQKGLTCGKLPCREEPGVQSDRKMRPLNSFKRPVEAELHKMRESAIEFIYEEILPEMIHNDVESDELPRLYDENKST